MDIQPNEQALIEKWLNAEPNGEPFPVPFEEAWKITGYKQKQHAKRRLTAKKSPLIEGEDYLSQSGQWAAQGRSSDLLFLTCDGFKHFCLMAETDKRRSIRQYFIEAEKNWRLVQEQHSTVAQEVEAENLRLQIAVLDRQNHLIDKEIRCRELDHTLLTCHGAPVVLALRGKSDQVVEVEKATVEVIDEKHNVNFRGQTLKQVAEHLKKTFGVEFKSGTALKQYLEENNAGHLVAQTPRSV
jgi:phage anti-repressor protein